jgi:hypothetical protein
MGTIGYMCVLGYSSFVVVESACVIDCRGIGVCTADIVIMGW